MLKSRKRTVDELLKLKQSVSLTGLSTATFEANMYGLIEAHSLFASRLPDGSVEPPMLSTFTGRSRIDLATRYFTPIQFERTSERQKFEKGVDPKGWLEKEAGDALFHCSDNVVKYFALTTSKGSPM